MLICHESLQLFYNQNKNQLEQNYPGISLGIFTDHFLRFSGNKKNDLILNNQYFYEQALLGVPFAYISREHFFYENEFYIDSRVLIPRSETEILVEDALTFLKNHSKKDLKVAEVGVGSFAIGLSLLAATKKNINLWGGDISEDALEVAKINLFKLDLKFDKKHTTTLELSDRLKNAPDQLDLIISNPPYIKRSQTLGVHHQVLTYEPDIALFLENDDFNRWFYDFFKQAYTKLSSGGAFMMEGHEDTLLDLEEMALKFFTKCEIKMDYTKRRRFLYCYKDK